MKDIDDSGWPIVLVTWKGPLADLDLERLLHALDGWLERGERFGLLIDSRGAHGAMSATQLQRLLSHMKGNAARSGRWMVQAVVHNSAALRALYAGVSFLFPLPFPSKTFPALEPARAWLVDKLASVQAAPKLRFELDDLSRPEVRALVTTHLQGMRAISPPESVHALDVGALRQPGVTFWSAWVGDALAGCGALKRLDADRGELKSMRVADGFLGKGIGRALLDHLLAQARKAGMRSVWLETGSSEPFARALKLYESAGFTRCGPFEGYREDPFSVFLRREL